MTTKEVYHNLRSAHRFARRNLLKDDAAFAVCVRITGELRSLCNAWDVGLGAPEPWAGWRRVRGRSVLFVSNSLSSFLRKTA